MGRVMQIAQVGGLHLRYERFAHEQAQLFAYSQRGHVVQVLFLCRRTHAPNRIGGPCLLRPSKTSLRLKLSVLVVAR
jgi:hypothetical protein